MFKGLHLSIDWRELLVYLQFTEPEQNGGQTLVKHSASLCCFIDQFKRFSNFAIGLNGLVFTMRSIDGNYYSLDSKDETSSVGQQERSSCSKYMKQ